MGERLPDVYECSVHGRQDSICCVTITTKNPPIGCSFKGCKSVFHRPQDALGDLSTADVAQLHGWTLIDREKGLLHCAWGHKE